MKIILTSIALLLSISSFAQRQTKPGNNRIESARIGMITNRLDLSTEQATAFWPVYNDYESRKTEVRKDLRKHLSESRSLASTDEKILAELKEMITLRQKEVDIDKEYLSKFLKVLQPRQVSELYKTEQQFKQLLLRRIENRDNKGPRNDKGPK